MATQTSDGPATITLDPAAILESMAAAVVSTVKAITDDAPKLAQGSPTAGAPGVVSSLEFTGALTTTFHLAVSAETGPALARSFLGIPVDFESQVMEDTLNELVNVIAGDIAADFSRKGTEMQIGLPASRRTNDLAAELPTAMRVDSEAGPFWIGATCPQSSS